MELARMVAISAGSLRTKELRQNGWSSQEPQKDLRYIPSWSCSTRIFLSI